MGYLIPCFVLHNRKLSCIVIFSIIEHLANTNLESLWGCFRNRHIRRDYTAVDLRFAVSAARLRCVLTVCLGPCGVLRTSELAPCLPQSRPCSSASSLPACKERSTGSPCLSNPAQDRSCYEKLGPVKVYVTVRDGTVSPPLLWHLRYFLQGFQAFFRSKLLRGNLRKDYAAHCL